MIITKVRLNRSPGAQGSLAKVLLSGSNADQSHGLVWTLFNHVERADERKDRAFLYREIEPGSFIVVAKTPPLDPHGLWVLDKPKDYAVEVSAGDRLSFVMRANPAVAVPRPGEKRGARADAIMHAKTKLAVAERKNFTAKDASTIAVQWLARRGPALGFKLDTEATSADGYQQIRIPGADRKPAIVYSEIEFTGALTVTDPNLLRHALYNGIGKARAYGCGLMLIRRA